MTSGFSASGPWVSPFSYAFMAAVLAEPGTSPTATSCSPGNGVVAYPVHGGNPTGGSGRSDVISCPCTNYE